MEVRRAYELMVISRPVSEDERKSLIEDIKKRLEKEGADVFFIDTMGKRTLAYTIDGEREGYYDLLYVAAYPSQFQRIERWMKLNKQILRFMFFRMGQKEYKRLNEKHPNVVLPEGVRLSRVK